VNCRKGNWRTYRAAGLAPLLAKLEVGEGCAINDSSPSFCTRAEHAILCTRALQAIHVHELNNNIMLNYVNRRHKLAHARGVLAWISPSPYDIVTNLKISFCRTI
jgi:hypothetical protein